MRRQSLFLLTFLLLAGLPTPVAAGEEVVWWEGEDAVETNFPDRTPFSAETFRDTKDEMLSAGDWLTNAGPREGPEAFARYDVGVAAAGEFSFWARKFWRHGPFRWRFDDDPWRTCGRDVGLADGVTIRTHLGANWVYLGRVRLAPGPHSFEIRLLAGPGDQQTACFDCFCLTTGSFLPRGRLKPRERTKNREDGWWAVDPDADPFGEAALDLRSLNDTVAGQHGFVNRLGTELVDDRLRPIRFWAVNCGPGIVNLGPDPVRYLARRLARSGVNCVRYHGPIWDKRAADPTAVDPSYLDRLHFFLAAMRAEGIYVTLSFYFPLWFERDGKKPFSLLFFDPEMQKIWRSWARTLLTTVNPYTGKKPVDDPAIAIVEIVNEDSFLFWTFKPGESITWDRMVTLERAFATWLAERHGTLEKARALFRGASHPRDGRDRMGLFDIWHLTGAGCGAGAHRLRASDQLRFLVETQRSFYGQTVDWLREELGLKCAVVASNWKTADRRVLGALERYTYTTTSVIDRHGYFGPRHEGDGASYSVRVGHEFRDRAGVYEIGATPIVGVGTHGFPEIVSEIGWPNPNRFRADFPLLTAVLGSWLGVDGYFFFAVGGMGFDSTPTKFPVSVPTVMGQFPGCALLYRTGIVPEGPVVIREKLDFERLYDFRGTRYANVPNLDAMRATGREADAGGEVPFLRGRILQEPVSGRVEKSPAPPPFAWDRKAGLFTLDTPRAKAATGFLAAAGPIRLGDVTIESKSEYGTILVIALDGKPIAWSERVLVQAVTEEKPFGFRAKNGRIESLGGYPMLVKEIDGQVTFSRTFRRARVLGLHGYARGEAKLTAGKRLRLPKDSLYTILE